MKTGRGKAGSRVLGMFLDLGASYISAFNLRKFTKPCIEHTCILSKSYLKKSLKRGRIRMKKQHASHHLTETLKVAQVHHLG